MATSSTVPRIQYLRVQNFRALRNIELKNITRLTVLLGPNGSGKTTRFDVFNFLSECFQGGLRQAWDKRGRGKELKTRGADGPVASRSSTARARPHRSSPTTCPSTRVARGR
jgi:predicted ATPase